MQVLRDIKFKPVLLGFKSLHEASARPQYGQTRVSSLNLPRQIQSQAALVNRIGMTRRFDSPAFRRALETGQTKRRHSNLDGPAFNGRFENPATSQPFRPL